MNVSLKNSRAAADVSLTAGDIQINGIDKTAVVFVGQQPIEFTMSLSAFQVNEYVPREEK